MITNLPFDFDDMEEWSSDVGGPDQVMPTSPATVKFDLFLKVREIKQLEGVIQSLKTRPPQERKAWLKANQTLVSDLVNDFTDDSLAKLQGVATDQESVKLSVDLVTTLRQTLLSLDGLMTESGQFTRRRSVTRIQLS